MKERLVRAWTIVAAWFVLTQAASALEVGDALPAFSLPGADGKPHSSAEYKDKELLAVVFLSNHCPTSQRFQDRLIRLAREYGPKGLAVVAISPNHPQAIPLDELAFSDLGDSLEDMTERAKQKKYPFDYLYDGQTQGVTKSFGASATPHAFLFDQKRTLRYAGRIGDLGNEERADRQELFQAVEFLLKGRPPPVTKTKVYGGTIRKRENAYIVERMLKRFAKETVYLKNSSVLNLEFMRQNKSVRTKLFFVWSTENPKIRDCLLALSEIHKIYRKRGLEWVTVNVDGEDHEEHVHGLLKETHSSGRNFLCRGSQISPLADLRGELGDQATPYLAIVRPGGEVAYRSTSGLDPLELKRQILAAFDKNSSHE